jgi:hypothetical protein
MAAAQDTVKPEATAKPKPYTIYEIYSVPGLKNKKWDPVGKAFLCHDGSFNLKPHRKLKPGNQYNIRSEDPPVEVAEVEEETEATATNENGKGKTVLKEAVKKGK